MSRKPATSFNFIATELVIRPNTKMQLMIFLMKFESLK